MALTTAATIGNSEIIELLELYLEAARKNRFGHVAISMVGHPNIACTDFAGDITLEVQERKAIDLLQQKLKYSIDGWTRPALDDRLDASYVCYNIANGPLGFDFLIWLIDAEMTRIREGAPSPLRVGFWMGHDSGRVTDTERRRLWLHNVFRPCLAFIGAVEDPHAVFGRCKNDFVPRGIVAAARNGEPVPRLQADPSKWNEPDLVTITLRECAYYGFRNSNIPEWTKAAEELQKRQERVIIVRDTAMAHEPLNGFRTCPEASINLDTRLALYESAKANLFVSNGVLGLALFGSKPWISFAQIDNDSEENCNTAAFWEQSNGVKVGEQYPWSGPDQRLVWQPDTYDNIMASWEQLGV